jgi:tetratricopeptide (TPR) repeat protein
MRALEAAGTAFYYAGDHERARGFYDAQLEVALEIGEPHGEADAMFNLAWTRDLTKEPVEAEHFFERISEAYRAAGDERGLARVLFIQGQVLLRIGRVESAIKVLLSAHERFRELDDVPYLAMAFRALGSAYLTQGDRDSAIRWFIDGLFRLSREVGDDLAIIQTLPAAAMAAIERGRPEAATIIMGAHESLSRSHGVRPPVLLWVVFEEYNPLQRTREALEERDFNAALERGRRMRLEDVVELIVGLEGDARKEG